MSTLTYLFSGLLFGIGLIVSGMTNPAKVMAFLDVTGAWDPSLIFVMIGAISIAFFAFQVAKHRIHTYLNLPMSLPSAHQIDTKLVAGSCLFGIGWGLSGFCPGPSIASIISGKSDVLLFVTAMLIGMAVYEVLEYHKSKLRPSC